MILFCAEAIFASSTSKFGNWIPLVDDEDLNSSTESNPCSEVSRLGSFHSTVMMFCVSLPDMSEHNMSIAESSWMDANQDKMACLSTKTR